MVAGTRLWNKLVRKAWDGCIPPGGARRLSSALVFTPPLLEGLEPRLLLTTYGPLLTFPTWNQASAINGTATTWNADVPLDPATGTRSYTGCTATAIAQVAYFWHFPQSISFNANNAYTSMAGTPSAVQIDNQAATYSFPTFAALSAGLATIQYDAAPAEEALLSFAMGILAQADYSSAGTAAVLTNNIFSALGFQSAREGDMNWGTAKPDVIASIAAGQPAIIGINGPEGAHAAILDGYNTTTDQFHLNLGWGGAYDGWYALPGFTAGPYTFTSIDTEVYNIDPILASPGGAAASLGTYTDHVHVSWNAVREAAGYQVWRSTTNDAASATRITPTNFTATTFNDYTAPAGQAEYYWIKAVSDIGISAFSAAIRGGSAALTPPATPVNVAPASAATGLSLAPTLSASAFSGSGVNTQTASQWVVRRSADSTVVFDSGTDVTDATSITLPAATLSAGTGYTWQVRYQDSGGLWSSFSTATTFTTQSAATPQATALTVTPSGSSVTFGQMETFTATLNVPAPGSGTPTGIVDFYADGTLLGGTVSSAGTATFSTILLSVGPHTITASYAGDASFTGSDSAQSPCSVTVRGAVTTLAVVPVAASLIFGQSDTFTATLGSTALNVATPGGSISFFDGTTLLGTSTLGAQVAIFSTSALGAGSHTITASYAGDANFSGCSAAPCAVLVNQAATILALTVAAANPAWGQALTVTATLTAPDGAGVAPTGSITFLDGATPLGSVPLDATGSASFTTSTLPPGAQQLGATYAPTAAWQGSAAPAVSVVVGTVHQRYVNQLYLDLLHRRADPLGLAAWTALLDGGASYNEVATDLTSSREYDANVVDAFYVTYLNRHAEAGGLNDWVNLMQQGYNAENIRAGILGSPEYFQDTGGTNDSFVTALYATFLGRTPDPGGFADWTGILGTGQDTRQDVASRFSNSEENRTAIITGFYQQFLHRAPDGPGLAAWKTLLANGITQPQIISSFVAAPEYLALNDLV